LPRIKYRRDYDWTPDFTTAGEEDEQITGNSWLSNAVIASQLSEDRIKTAIQALKAQITVLENELLSRRLGHRHQTYKDWDAIGDSYPEQDGKRYSRSSSGRRDRSSDRYKKIRKTLKKLGVADVNALLQEWEKLMKG